MLWHHAIQPPLAPLFHDDVLPGADITDDFWYSFIKRCIQKQRMFDLTHVVPSTIWATFNPLYKQLFFEQCGLVGNYRIFKFLNKRFREDGGVLEIVIDAACLHNHFNFIFELLKSFFPNVETLAYISNETMIAILSANMTNEHARNILQFVISCGDVDYIGFLLSETKCLSTFWYILYEFTTVVDRIGDDEIQILFDSVASFQEIQFCRLFWEFWRMRDQPVLPSLSMSPTVCRMLVDEFGWDCHAQNETFLYRLCQMHRQSQCRDCLALIQCLVQEFHCDITVGNHRCIRAALLSQRWDVAQYLLDHGDVIPRAFYDDELARCSPQNRRRISKFMRANNIII